MATKAANKRLTKEYKSMVENPPPYIIAHPSERNILEWHYVITGPPNTPYEGGQYHGLLIFPRDYPFKPPEIRMVTPSGRFATNTRLCLSMSDYHPDTWQPAWSVATILNGLLSFMTGDEPTTGSVVSSHEAKRRFARASLEWNVKHNHTFTKEFPDLVEENMAKSKERAQRELADKQRQQQDQELKKQRAAELTAGKVNLDTMDPEDRIRFLAAQQANSKGNKADSKYTYWACCALAIAVLLGLLTVTN